MFPTTPVYLARILALAALAPLFLLIGNASWAESNSPSASVDRLTQMLVGEFDSSRQSRADKLAGVPPTQFHGWVNRNFIVVEAPEVSDYPVLVGSTRYLGFNWYFDKTEFLVWTFAPSADGKSIVMSPRRFKALDAKIPFATNAEKLSGFTPDDLEQAISGAACDVIWTPTNDGFRGESAPCQVMSTTTGVNLNWKWQYSLNDRELWVAFEGIDDSGNRRSGTPINSPFRLDRLTNVESMTLELIGLLWGEFDSQRQMLEDERNNVAPAMKHHQINRANILVSAPEVDEWVMVGTTAFQANSKWIFDSTEFLVWTFQPGDDGDSVVMSPRKFKDPTPHLPFSRDYEKFNSFAPNELVPVTNRSKCEIVWRRNGDGFIGTSKSPCQTLDEKLQQMVSWTWNMTLDTKTWGIELIGVTDSNELVKVSTPKDSPYRLDRKAKAE